MLSRLLFTKLTSNRPAILRTHGRANHHHTHRCISCGVPLGRHHQRPAGEIRAAGIWGDACPRCYLQHRLLQDDTQPPPAVFRTPTLPL